MTKLYRIDSYGYGGEVTVGTVSPEFVEYWKDKNENDLLSHVMAREFGDLDNIDDEDFDKNSPELPKDTCWHEIDDVAHSNGAYEDSNFLITEVETSDDDEENATTKKLEMNSLGFERGCTLEENQDGYIPVLIVHSSEKGSFESWILETDTEFNPDRLAFTVSETNICNVVESAYYDKEELEPLYLGDTTGKSMNAHVGYINPEWQDEIDQKSIDEYFDDLDADESNADSPLLPINFKSKY